MKVAIFASGSGSNAEALIKRLNASNQQTVALLVCNNPGAGVLKRAEKLQVPAWIISKEELANEALMNARLEECGIHFIVLAGFLWQLPAFLVRNYPGKIINIHPALLPKFGGKGMYGRHVHEAVIAAGEKESGITIHYVNDHYDEGKIILQKTCAISKGETPESLALKIQALEHAYYPETVERMLDQLQKKES